MAGKSPSWNAKPVGTRREHPEGYIEVKIAGSHRWKLEHRVIWEAVHGPIPHGNCVHHLNENKTDNRLENLALCSSHSEHLRKFHADAIREGYRRMGRGGKGVPKSPAHRAAIAAALKGHKQTPEHVAHHATAVRGKTPWNKRGVA